jgi:hypothetical protein
MNDIFSLQRLGWYARKEFYENWKLYALAILAMLAWFGVMYYLIYQQLTNGNVATNLNAASLYKEARMIALMGTLVVGGVLVASHSLHHFATKSKTLATLILPVSALERMVYATLLAIPVFGLVVLSFWQGVDWIVRPIFEQRFPELSKPIVEYAYKSNSSNQMSLSILLISVSFMLGAVTLGRLNMLKTGAAAFLILWFVYFVLRKFVLDFLFGTPDVRFGGTPVFGFSWISIDGKSYNLESAYQFIMDFWWGWALPVLLWVVTYFKIKEKEA